MDGTTLGSMAIEEHIGAISTVHIMPAGTILGFILGTTRSITHGTALGDTDGMDGIHGILGIPMATTLGTTPTIIITIGMEAE